MNSGHDASSDSPLHVPLAPTATEGESVGLSMAVGTSGSGARPATDSGTSGFNNPKHILAQKSGKAPLEYLVVDVLEEEAAVLAHGAAKYGVRNWRVEQIAASTYEGAMLRHLFAWIRGEDTDPDSGKSHLAHLRACTTVVMDSQARGMLVDDRGRAESKDKQDFITTPVMPYVDLTKWDGLKDGDEFVFDAGDGLNAERRSVKGEDVYNPDGDCSGHIQDRYYQDKFVKYVVKVAR